MSLPKIRCVGRHELLGLA